MASNSILLDGKWVRGFFAGRARKSWPFAQNGDYQSIIVVREWRQSERTFIPGKRGVDKDPVYSDAYLILESDPEPIGQGDALSVIRTYARIPAQQTVPSSIQVNKPEITGEFPQTIGSFTVFQPVATTASYDGYLTKTVTSDSGAPSSSFPTGGTYTLTFDGDTTGAIAYDATSGTVQTALNLLTSIADRGNVAVTGSYNTAAGFTITFGSYATATLNTGSLTITSGTASTTVTLTDSGYTQTVLVACGFTARITGGTFTITMFGQTTAAIAFNATPAQVAAALNLLTEIQERGNVTVSAPGGLIGSDFFAAGEPNKLRFTIAFSNAVFTASSSSLTPVGSVATPAITDVIGRTQSLTFTSPAATRTLGVSAGHEIITGDTVYVKDSLGNYYTDITAFTIPGTTTITLNAGASAAYIAATSLTEVGKLAIENYTPGVANTPCSRVTNFYLPGVSAGISSAADIPLPDRQSDASALLAAIFSGDTSIYYDVGDLEQWLGSPILALTVTTLNAAQI